MESANVAAVRAMLELFSNGDIDRLVDGLMAEDVELDYSRSMSPDLTGVYRGRDDVRRFLGAIREPWERLEIVPDEFVELSDDTVVTASRTRNVGRGSGIVVTARGASVFRLRDGRLAEWKLFQSKADALADAQKPRENSKATPER